MDGWPRIPNQANSTSARPKITLPAAGSVVMASVEEDLGDGMYSLRWGNNRINVSSKSPLKSGQSLILKSQTNAEGKPTLVVQGPALPEPGSITGRVIYGPGKARAQNINQNEVDSQTKQSSSAQNQSAKSSQSQDVGNQVAAGTGKMIIQAPAPTQPVQSLVGLVLEPMPEFAASVKVMTQALEDEKERLKEKEEAEEEQTEEEAQPGEGEEENTEKASRDKTARPLLVRPAGPALTAPARPAITSPVPLSGTGGASAETGGDALTGATPADPRVPEVATLPPTHARPVPPIQSQTQASEQPQTAMTETTADVPKEAGTQQQTHPQSNVASPLPPTGIGTNVGPTVPDVSQAANPGTQQPQQVQSETITPTQPTTPAQGAQSPQSVIRDSAAPVVAEARPAPQPQQPVVPGPSGSMGTAQASQGTQTVLRPVPSQPHPQAPVQSADIGPVIPETPSAQQPSASPPPQQQSVQNDTGQSVVPVAPGATSPTQNVQQPPTDPPQPAPQVPVPGSSVGPVIPETPPAQPPSSSPPPPQQPVQNDTGQSVVSVAPGAASPTQNVQQPPTDSSQPAPQTPVHGSSVGPVIPETQPAQQPSASQPQMQPPVYNNFGQVVIPETPVDASPSQNTPPMLSAASSQPVPQAVVQETNVGPVVTETLPASSPPVSQPQPQPPIYNGSGPVDIPETPVVASPPQNTLPQSPTALPQPQQQQSPGNGTTVPTADTLQGTQTPPQPPPQQVAPQGPVYGSNNGPAIPETPAEQQAPTQGAQPSQPPVADSVVPETPSAQPHTSQGTQQNPANTPPPQQTGGQVHGYSPNAMPSTYAPPRHNTDALHARQANLPAAAGSAASTTEAATAEQEVRPEAVLKEALTQMVKASELPLGGGESDSIKLSGKMPDAVVDKAADIFLRAAGLTPDETTMEAARALVEHNVHVDRETVQALVAVAAGVPEEERAVMMNAAARLAAKDVPISPPLVSGMADVIDRKNGAHDLMQQAMESLEPDPASPETQPLMQGAKELLEMLHVDLGQNDVASALERYVSTFGRETLSKAVSLVELSAQSVLENNPELQKIDAALTAILTGLADELGQEQLANLAPGQTLGPQPLSIQEQPGQAIPLPVQPQARPSAPINAYLNAPRAFNVAEALKNLPPMPKIVSTHQPMPQDAATPAPNTPQQPATQPELKLPEAQIPVPAPAPASAGDGTALQRLETLFQIPGLNRPEMELLRPSGFMERFLASAATGPDAEKIKSEARSLMRQLTSENPEHVQRALKELPSKEPAVLRETAAKLSERESEVMRQDSVLNKLSDASTSLRELGRQLIAVKAENLSGRDRDPGVILAEVPLKLNDDTGDGRMQMFYRRSKGKQDSWTSRVILDLNTTRMGPVLGDMRFFGQEMILNMFVEQQETADYLGESAEDLVAGLSEKGFRVKARFMVLPPMRQAPEIHAERPEIAGEVVDGGISDGTHHLDIKG